MNTSSHKYVNGLIRQYLTEDASLEKKMEAMRKILENPVSNIMSMLYEYISFYNKKYFYIQNDLSKGKQHYFNKIKIYAITLRDTLEYRYKIISGSRENVTEEMFQTSYNYFKNKVYNEHMPQIKQGFIEIQREVEEHELRRNNKPQDPLVESLGKYIRKIFGNDEKRNKPNTEMGIFLSNECKTQIRTIDNLTSRIRYFKSELYANSPYSKIIKHKLNTLQDILVQLVHDLGYKFSLLEHSTKKEKAAIVRYIIKRESMITYNKVKEEFEKLVADGNLNEQAEPKTNLSNLIYPIYKQQSEKIDKIRYLVHTTLNILVDIEKDDKRFFPIRTEIISLTNSCFELQKKLRKFYEAASSDEISLEIKTENIKYLLSKGYLIPYNEIKKDFNALIKKHNLHHIVKDIVKSRPDKFLKENISPNTDIDRLVNNVYNQQIKKVEFYETMLRTIMLSVDYNKHNIINSLDMAFKVNLEFGDLHSQIRSLRNNMFNNKMNYDKNWTGDIKVRSEYAKKILKFNYLPEFNSIVNKFNELVEKYDLQKEVGEKTRIINSWKD